MQQLPLKDTVPPSSSIHLPPPVVDLPEKNGNALWQAAIWGDAESLKAELELGVDVNLIDKDRANRTALHQSAEFGHVACVAVLLDAPGIIVDAMDKGARSTPLQRAADNGNAEVCRLLLAAKADTAYKHKRGDAASSQTLL